MRTSKSLSNPLNKVDAKAGLAKIPKSLSTTAIVGDGNGGAADDDDLNNNNNDTGTVDEDANEGEEEEEEDVEPAVESVVNEDNVTDANNNQDALENG